MSGSFPAHFFDHKLKRHPNSPNVKYPIAILLFCLFLITLLPTSAMAASVAFEWTPANPSNEEGYMLHIRVKDENYNYKSPVWIGKTASCRVDGLVPGTTYFMVVRAYNEKGPSGDSNEVTYTVPGTPPQNTSAAKINPSVKSDARAEANKSGSHAAAKVTNKAANTRPNSRPIVVSQLRTKSSADMN